MRNRTDCDPWYHLLFGMTPALIGQAPRPDNGGHTVGTYCRVQSKAPGRLGRRITGAYTHRSLSWLPHSAYCFPSVPLHNMYAV